MAKRDLNELKEGLWDAFDAAAKYGKDDITRYNNNPSHQAGGEILKAAASIAQTILNIEREQREAEAAKPFKIAR